MSQQTIAISAETLLSLPHDALIALYNTESRHLAHGLEPHQVDETCKPLYIIKLMAKLPIRYAMMANELSNERAAMALPIEEVAERKATKAEKRIENAMLTKGNQGFILLK